MKLLLLHTFAAAAAFLPVMLYGQVEVLPESENQRYEAMLPELAGKSSGVLAEHLKRAAGKDRKAKINAVRTALDLQELKTASPVLHYAVPATSETQYLPDVYPFDGEAAAPLRIVSAQDEFEPASFVVYPLQDLGKVAFEVSDLKSEDGAVFAKADLDFKTVKVWYQCGNGWFSYFGDPDPAGLKLCPELLLNDEDLIKVDQEKKVNYARLTAKDGKITYRLLNVPEEMDSDFSCMVPEFQDSAAFRGAALNEGEFKQFFLTAHVKKGQKAGLYKGTVSMKKDGREIASIPVELRVLPFILPAPMTYNDLNKEFRDFMSGYINIHTLRRLNGGDQALAEKQLHALMVDFVNHNEKMPNHYERAIAPEWAEKAGMDNSSFIAGEMLLGAPSEMRFDARRKAEWLKQTFGNNKNYYLDWGDEFGLSLQRAIRPMVDIYQSEGNRYTGNSPSAYTFAMYMIDFYRIAVWPDFSTNRLAEKISFIDDSIYFGMYASQHVGVENPAFCRRQYGLGPYRAGLTCSRNYAHHLNGYNDNAGWYKPMNLVYGDGKGVIDTISWEGYREGMDDIRYATLLQQTARPLLKSENYQAKYAARKALQFLADMNTDDFDLSTARLEMIRHILTLRKFAK